MIVFETDRLIIRRVITVDEAMLFHVYSDPDAMRYVDDGHPIERDACRRWIDVTLNNYEKYGYGMFAIDLRGTSKTIGFCGLVHPGGQAEPEIKYAFLRAYWTKGYATESGRALLDWGRDIGGLTQIIATVASGNAASQRVLVKIGMSKVRTDQSDGAAIDVYSISFC